MAIENNAPTLDDFVDLSRYPIHQLDSQAGRNLVKSCHEMMANDSSCVLPGFLYSEMTGRLAEEISALEKDARKVDFMSTAYGWMSNTGFSDPHPRSQLFRRRCGAMTTEQLNANGLCVQLFQFDELTDFVRRLLGYKALYRSACPTISVRLNIMEEGDEFGWHFDTNDGVVSFITQNAESGGVFEYAPLIRSEDDENYLGVSRILRGEDAPHKAETPPGTFTLFMGRRSLHRVSRVGGSSRSRQSLLFSYDQQPDQVFPDAIRKRLIEPSNDDFKGM